MEAWFYPESPYDLNIPNDLLELDRIGDVLIKTYDGGTIIIYVNEGKEIYTTSGEGPLGWEINPSCEDVTEFAARRARIAARIGWVLEQQRLLVHHATTIDQVFKHLEAAGISVEDDDDERKEALAELKEAVARYRRRPWTREDWPPEF